MSFFELAEKRKSVRQFLDRPVEQEKIGKILERPWQRQLMQLARSR